MVEGASVRAGTELVVVMAMKMEHVVLASQQGTVKQLLVAVGDVVQQGSPLMLLQLHSSDAVDASSGAEEGVCSLDHVRSDLQGVLDRAHRLEDESRMLADAKFEPRRSKRHAQGQQTARENVVQLVDPGSFVEYGKFAIAAQRTRRAIEDLIDCTPCDGIITGDSTLCVCC